MDFRFAPFIAEPPSRVRFASSLSILFSERLYSLILQRMRLLYSDGFIVAGKDFIHHGLFGLFGD